MRALAVLAVVAYHAWPSQFPGGYVGVDVFFVLSGYLITGNMLREVAQTGRLNLQGFWASRVRRILPASLVAITVSCIVGTYLLPPTTLNRTADDAVAATIYTINWVLAGQSVEYLAATNDPTIYQHYWSLAVEEQFYLVWPLLIAAVVLVTRGLMRGQTTHRNQDPAALTRITRRLILMVFLVLTVASFLYSLSRAGIDPTAYFVTTARLWELGIGALLALLPGRFALPDNVRSFCGLGAVALVVYATFSFNAGTPFPGLAALVPTGASALVILAGPLPDAFFLKHVSEFAPVQWMGNISYSLYLWHFPVIIVWAASPMGRLPVVSGVAVIAISIALAACSYYLVENPVRKSSWLRARPFKTLLIFALAMAVTVASTALPRLRETQLLADGVSTDKRIEIGKEGWLFYTLLDNLRLPQPDYRLSADVVDGVVASQRRVTDYYSRVGVDYYVGIPPAKTTVYPELMRDDGLKVGITVADVLLEALASRADAQTIDLKSAMLDRKRTGKVYGKLDTHWTHLGAYAAYSSIVQQFVLDGVLERPARPVTVRFSDRPNSGDLSRMLGRDWTDEVPVAQWEAHSTEVPASEFRGIMDDDCPTPCILKVLANPAVPDRTLLIYGDSFSAVGQILIPRWLAEHFSTVVLVTSGQPILPGLELAVQPDVVLYLPNERYSAQFLTNADKLIP